MNYQYIKKESEFKQEQKMSDVEHCSLCCFLLQTWTSVLTPHTTVTSMVYAQTTMGHFLVSVKLDFLGKEHLEHVMVRSCCEGDV